MTFKRFLCCSVVLIAGFVPLVLGQPGAGEKGGQDQPKIDDKKQPPKIEEIKFPSIPTILDKESRPIDLASALQLAGVQNPEILLARERVIEATALRQLAAAQFLPSINFGTNLDHHNGMLQQSNGNMLKVNRDSLYLGLGSSAVGAGTVNIPGIVWSGNVSTTIFQSLASRQVVRQRQFASDATRNEMLLRVAQSYLELLRAEGRSRRRIGPTLWRSRASLRPTPRPVRDARPTRIARRRNSISATTICCKPKTIYSRHLLA